MRIFLLCAALVALVGGFVFALGIGIPVIDRLLDALFRGGGPPPIY